MSDSEDKDSKTEDATQRKIDQALEKGNVPVSRELVLFGSLAGIVLALSMSFAQAAREMVRVLAIFFENVDRVHLENSESFLGVLVPLSQAVAGVLLPVVAIIAVGGLIAAAVQNVPRISVERIMPQWERISPAAGFGRIFGKAGFLEFLKSIVKLVIVSAVLADVGWREVPRLLELMRLEGGDIAPAVFAMARRLVLAVAIIFGVLAGADVVVSRLQWRARLRMSKQEIKDEMRQSDGDPVVKMRLRALRQRRASRRMMQAVPRATLVITNPTHFAIALRYVREEGGAPIVLAKGVDETALRIRNLAKRHGIETLEDRPLARALYDAVEVGAMIPPEFYRAVAEIIHLLNNRKPRS